MTEQTRVITSTKLTKELLASGFAIIDIAPKHSNPDKTVFIFEATTELLSFIERREKTIESKTNTKHKLRKYT